MGTNNLDRMDEAGCQTEDEMMIEGGYERAPACYAPGMGTTPQPGTFRADQIRPGEPYELSEGHLVACLPTGGRGSGSNQLGASVVGWDPAVEQAGVDAGYSPRPSVLRAPDVAVGNVPNEPGWIAGAPELAIEYADVGEEEEKLQAKIRDLLSAGTKIIWVVRLVGERRVEIHEPGQSCRTAWPGEHLAAPGILRNPVPVEALYERKHAEQATLRNLLQRQGYESLEAVRAEGRLVEARAALRRVLRLRGLETAFNEASIEACADLDTLERWLDEAIVAAGP
jgi:Uma2 family endonuclease